MQNSNEKASMRTINILSVVIPVAVAALLGIRTKIDLGSWTKVLPHFIGAINTLTSITLILGFYFVKNGNIKRHRQMMGMSFLQGSLFLVLYILYHISNKATSSLEMPSIVRMVYLTLLGSHILLSIVVVWFVLRAMYFALTNQIDKHKKIVKWTFPLWLYVSVSGVIVYLMISPYYV